MGKLIDADALIFDLKTSLVPQSVDYTNAVGIALHWLRKTPEAVVRCKDCQYYHDLGDICDCINVNGLDYVSPDDFCSLGRRRADDDK